MSPTLSVSCNRRTSASQSSPGTRDSTDTLGRLSLAQNSLRKLREELSEREDELNELRAEKEKYESSHGKIYSQISSIRSKCQALEHQLARKSAECEAVGMRNQELEGELVKLKTLFVEESAKHMLRIKTLDSSLASAKSEIESLCKYQQSLEGDNSYKDERAKLLAHIDHLKKTAERDRNAHQAELQELHLLNDDLNGRLEESRTAMNKLSAEKTLALNDYGRLKEERTARREAKSVAWENELHMRLAELETERSNAKTALKKAMAVIDQEESTRAELALREEQIILLQEEISKLREIKLPSIDDLDCSLAHMHVSSSQALAGSKVAPVAASPEERLLKLTPPSILEKANTAVAHETLIPTEAIEIKTAEKSNDLKTKLSVIREMNCRLRQLSQR